MAKMNGGNVSWKAETETDMRFSSGCFRHLWLEKGNIKAITKKAQWHSSNDMGISASCSCPQLMPMSSCFPPGNQGRCYLSPFIWIRLRSKYPLHFLMLSCLKSLSSSSLHARCLQLCWPCPLVRWVHTAGWDPADSRRNTKCLTPLGVGGGMWYGWGTIPAMSLLPVSERWSP